MKLSHGAFRKLAERCLAAIPRSFRRLLYNVRIRVEDAPGSEAGRLRGSRDLLGLYVGLARADMVGPFSGTYEPARVFLYQANIEARCAAPEELERLVSTTLRHELAHHFGFSEKDIREKWPEGA